MPRLQFHVYVDVERRLLLDSDGEILGGDRRRAQQPRLRRGGEPLHRPLDLHRRAQLTGRHTSTRHTGAAFVPPISFVRSVAAPPKPSSP